MGCSHVSMHYVLTGNLTKIIKKDTASNTCNLGKLQPDSLKKPQRIAPRKCQWTNAKFINLNIVWDVVTYPCTLYIHRKFNQKYTKKHYMQHLQPDLNEKETKNCTKKMSMKKYKSFKFMSYSGSVWIILFCNGNWCGCGNRKYSSVV